MQQRLPLSRPTQHVSRLAVGLYLPNVSSECIPAFNLSCVLFGNSAPHIVPAVPLEPATRIVFVYPSLAAPFGEWLRGFYFEIVQIFVSLVCGKFCMGKPRLWEFLSAVSHVDATKCSQTQDFCWSKLWSKCRVNALPWRFCKRIAVSLLHLVVHYNDDWFFEWHRRITDSKTVLIVALRLQTRPIAGMEYSRALPTAYVARLRSSPR